MNVVLIGPPGSGKGTLSEWIKNTYSLNYLSTGDLFREEIKKGTELGLLADKLISNGEFIPDELTCDIVLGYVEKKDGYLLDGFPRTLFQAEQFASFNQQHSKKIDYILYFNLNFDIIEERLTNRRVCSSCKSIYHLKNKPSKTEGICDVCGGELEQRKDDREEFIQKRLDIYQEVTLPVVHYYQEHQPRQFFEINADRSIEEIKSELSFIING